MGDVTVTIPMWRAGATILRAVESALAQDADLLDRVLVLNDGDPDPAVWKPLAGIDDPRLVRVDLPANRGRYAADHIAVHQLITSGWWAPLDADDWIEPDHLASLMTTARSGDVDVVLAPQWIHPMTRRGPASIEQVRPWDGSANYRWHGHLGGLWRVAWVRELGLTNPWERIGWDTMMTSVPWLTGRVNVAAVATYHRVRRRGSLTTSPETAPGSPARRDAAARQAAMWARIVADPARVSEVLALARPRFSAADLVKKPGWDAGDGMSDNWAVTSSLAAELDRRLHELQPAVVVECGSGRSTQVFARYARRSGAHVVALEHHAAWRARTLAALGAYQRDVDVRLAPLVGSPPMYDCELPDRIGFALIDGPPTGQGGRAATLPALWPHLDHEGGWEVWLDDGERVEERAAVQEWGERFAFHVEHTHVGRGMIRLTSRARPRRQPDVSGLVITVLSGGRPSLLADTLANLPAWLHSATIVALANGGDADTVAVYRDHGIEPIKSGRLLPIGRSVGLLARYALDSGKPLWLHLEDDWRHITLDSHWWESASTVLATEPEVAQVRLRHHSEQTLGRHMVTTRPIQPSWHWAGRIMDAHLTFNPSIGRTRELARLFPVSGEKEFMRAAHRAGLRQVVQLYPGAFVHTGDQDSLRKRTNCRP